MRNLLLLLAIVLSGTAAAQELSMMALTIPAELKENAKSVVRDHEEIYTAVSPREATLTVRHVVTLLDDGHGRANQLVVFYDNDTKIVRLNATLYDGLGNKVRTAKKSEIEDISAVSGGTFYSDSRVKTVTLTHLSYPYTVEFEYEIKAKDFGAFKQSPSWLPQEYEQSVVRSECIAYVHAGNKLAYRAHDLPEPTVTTEKGYTVMKWTVSNLPAYLKEGEAPPATRTLPFLYTALRDVEVGNISLTNQDWKSFGQKMLQLHEDIRTLTPDLQTKVRESVAGLTTDRDKIAALYALVQGRTRYVGVQLGIGGWQPFSAEYVEENRFGDCKALSNYLGAMLDEVGIENYPVLVNWADRSPVAVEQDFTASAFNHMILYVPGEEIYLECTSNDWPTGYLGDGKQDRNVLWLTPEGGELVRIPAHIPGEHGHVRTVDLTITPEGNAEFDLRAGFFGTDHEDIRMFVGSEADPGKQREGLHRYGELPDVSGSDYSVDVDPDNPRLDLSYRTVLPKYVRKLGKRMFVPLNKLYRYDWVPDQLSERHFPIVKTEARFLVDTVHLTLPDNLEVESLGEPETIIQHAVGEYRSEVKTGPGKLTWIRTLKLVPVELPASEYEEYRAFYVAVSKAERRQVVLREKRTK